MSRVYISPSTQEANIGLGNYGTEEKRMNEIADLLIPILEDHGVLCYRNHPTMTAAGAKDHSNKLGVDAHVAIHSNAGGGRGATVFTSGTLKSKKLADLVYSKLEPVTPYSPDRGVRATTTFTEVVRTNAPAILIEVSFHDNWQDATWIIQHQPMIAQAIADGIMNYFNIKVSEPFLPTHPDSPFPSSPFNPAPSGYKWMLIRE